MPRRKVAPTPQQSSAYQALFDYFNAELFDRSLPPIILNFSRHANSYGFFAAARWDNGKAVTHEIGLNPSHLKARPPLEVVATLVHEMVHLWQQEHGAPSRQGYHNREWASKMEQVGLVPSHTGEPGGRKVGVHMTHYIDEKGPFLRAFRRMPKAFLLPWQCLPEPASTKGKKAPSRNKVKYTCPDCGANVWGKPDLAILCVDCDAQFALVA